jgi:methyl-accepting chemotaxis protein
MKNADFLRVPRQGLLEELSHKSEELLRLREEVSTFCLAIDKNAVEKAEMASVIERAKENSLLIHEAYLKRLTQQTESTIQLSETVTTIFATVKEIAGSYKAMLDAIHAVTAISNELRTSFQVQAGAQDAVAGQIESANIASSVELQKAQSLKEDLGQIEGIRKFMSEAVESIDEISSKLSLLSMNGRIEAAHAGAIGRGFGVVAHEMLGLQQESQRIIASERSKLKSFLPLMATMQNESGAVEVQAQSQRRSLEAISEGTQVIRDKNRTNLDRISDLASSLERLVASIDTGQQSIDQVEQAVAKVEKIFTEEVFVSKKMNDLDTFIFSISKKAGSLVEAAHSVVNEYQRISILNGVSYVWQAEAWLITGRHNLPVEIQALSESNRWGDRVLVCIGQTDNNPSIPVPLDARRGILAVHPLDELKDPRSRIQGLNNFLCKAGLSLADIEDPRRINRSLKHATMSCLERFEGDYAHCLRESIEKGRLVCTFTFGGIFSNGDVLMNHFLSTYQRTEQDAEKFSLLGESLVMGLHTHVENGRYWQGNDQ